MTLRSVLRPPLLVLLFLLGATVGASAETVTERIDGALEPISDAFVKVIFCPVPFTEVPIVLVLLAGTALFLTLYFGFINLRAFKLALKTVRGKYLTGSDPGQITHFQALSTALSATVGLGNIAGVAIAISIGGPGAVLWMIIMGFLGMTSKFTECTLGVKYRRIDEKGRVHGGGMFYLKDGLKERGLGGLGAVLAVIFAVACIGGALGAGNMFQMNQAAVQVSEAFGVFGGNASWQLGLIVAVLVGLVIIGGIVWIARVTEFLVPIMCIVYLIGCLIVLVVNAAEVPGAFVTIVKEAFAPTAAAGGFIGGLIQGIRRGVFSNEAGVGSAGIAHAAVKTDKPASEGVVALLEPFVDTVVVCTMTALVIVVAGTWKVNSEVRIETVSVLEQPVVGSPVVATYQKKEMLKAVGNNWQQATIKDSKARGWLRVGSLTAVEGKTEQFKNEGEEGVVLLARPKDDKEVWWLFSLIGPKVTVLESAGGKKEVGKIAPGETVTVVTRPVLDDEGKPKKDDTGNPVVEPVVWAKVSHPDHGTPGWVIFPDLNDRSNYAGGIWRTSRAFETVIGWFPFVLAIAVFLFAFSTMISWSYYGQQALGFLCKENGVVIIIYKIIFCGCVVVGAAASLDNVINLSDSLFFAMVVPNLVGLFVLLPVVKRELGIFQAHAKEIDAKDS